MPYNRDAVAPGSTRTDSNPEFIRHLQHLARRLFFSAPTITQRNKDFLQEFASGEGRYQLVALQRLIMCARASTNPADREALAEIIRAECLKDLPQPSSLAAVFDEELAATNDADMPQRQFERSPTRATLERARDSLIRQLAATRRSLDVVLTYRL